MKNPSRGAGQWQRTVVPESSLLVVEKGIFLADMDNDSILDIAGASDGAPASALAHARAVGAARHVASRHVARGTTTAGGRRRWRWRWWRAADVGDLPLQQRVLAAPPSSEVQAKSCLSPSA